MNICIFTKSLNKGGAEKQSVLLSSVLCNHHKTYLTVLFGSDTINYNYLLKNCNAEIHFFSGTLLKRFIHFVRFLRQKKIDVIFCYLFSTNILGTLAGKLANVKYIIGGIRNSHHPFIKEIGLRIIHNNFSTHTISNSFSAFDLLTRKNFNASKMSVIPNGILLKKRKEFLTRKETVTILTVARFVKQKDHKTAIDAVNYLYKHLLRRRMYGLKYYIVGYGRQKKSLKKYIKKHNLESIIELIETDDIASMYDKADIYLCTSLFEGVSNSILEAMNNTLPIVATDVGDNRYLVHHESSGFLCTVGDFRGVARSLYTIVTNAFRRVNMGRESHKILQKNYSEEIFKQRYLNFIDSLTSNSEYYFIAPNGHSIKTKLNNSAPHNHSSFH